MADATTTSLALGSDTSARVRRLAIARHQSPDMVMREAIGQYVARQEAREQLRVDTLAAWAEYQATGLRLTEEEMDAWFARLGAGEDVEPPECHACSGRLVRAVISHACGPSLQRAARMRRVAPWRPFIEA